MTHIEESTELSRNADDAWRAFGAWQAVGSWHPMLERVEVQGSGPGATRRAITTDGQEQVERLEAYDDASRCYRYAMIETALPVESYVAEFRINAADANHSRVIWSARFDDKSGTEEGVKAVRGFFNAGLAALAAL